MTFDLDENETTYIRQMFNLEGVELLNLMNRYPNATMGGNQLSEDPQTFSLNFNDGETVYYYTLQEGTAVYQHELKVQNPNPPENA